MLTARLAGKTTPSLQHSIDQICLTGVEQHKQTTPQLSSGVAKIPRCQYGNNSMVMAIGAFRKYLHNEIFDKQITSLYCTAAYKTRKRQHL